jgi:hypothetical protein
MHHSFLPLTALPEYPWFGEYAARMAASTSGKAYAKVLLLKLARYCPRIRLKCGMPISLVAAQ